MSHRQHKVFPSLRHPTGLRKSVPDAICHSGNSSCLKNRGQGACSRTKDYLCVLSTRASGGPGLEQGGQSPGDRNSQVIAVSPA